jgi:hypothetical protein
MTLAHRKGAVNEVDPLSQRPNFVPRATVTTFGDGEVTTEVPAVVRRRAIKLIDW